MGKLDSGREKLASGRHGAGEKGGGGKGSRGRGEGVGGRGGEEEAGGKYSLGNCFRILEVLKVLWVDTKKVDLEKKIAEVRQETRVGEGDKSSEGMEDDEVDEVDLV